MQYFFQSFTPNHEDMNIETKRQDFPTLYMYLCVSAYINIWLKKKTHKNDTFVASNIYDEYWKKIYNRNINFILLSPVLYESR